MSRYHATLSSLLLIISCSDTTTEPAGTDAAHLVHDAGVTVDGVSADTATVTPDAAPDSAGVVARIGFVALERSNKPRVKRVIYGEAVAVRVTGLAASERISIGATYWGYRSTATFVADRDGVVDTSRDAPESGDYKGVDADGLIWSASLERESNQRTFDVAFDVERVDHERLEAVLGRDPLDADEDVRDVRDDGLVGTLFTPIASKGPHPVVIVVGGSEGGLGSPEFTAAYVTSLGDYAALALAYFGEPGLPQGLTEIPLEYFEKALRWIARQPELDSKRIAVFGGSRGGELALMLGARFPAVRAVIAEVPSGVRWGSAHVARKAAWTYGGKPLTYLSSTGPSSGKREKLPNGQTGVRLAASFNDTLDKGGATVAAATIAVEKTKGPILMLGGDDDGLWPSCRLASIAFDRLTSSGHTKTHVDRSICFKDAGHSIGPPGWSTRGSYATRHPALTGALMVLGGTAQGTARAQRAARTEIRDFLAGQL